MEGDLGGGDKRGAGAGAAVVVSSLQLGVRVSLGTYRIFYEGGKEDYMVRRRGEGEERELRRRAAAREEERRRCRLLK